MNEEYTIDFYVDPDGNVYEPPHKKVVREASKGYNKLDKIMQEKIMGASEKNAN